MLLHIQCEFGGLGVLPNPNPICNYAYSVTVCDSQCLPCSVVFRCCSRLSACWCRTSCTACLPVSVRPSRPYLAGNSSKSHYHISCTAALPCSRFVTSILIGSCTAVSPCSKIVIGILVGPFTAASFPIT